MTKVDTSLAPYKDDFDEKKKFYKILFKPGKAVQIRELNQLQTMLQKQIERFGNHIFQNGAQVLPGSRDGVKYRSNVGWIKIPRTDFANDETELTTYWLNKDIKSTSIPNNIKATVIGFRVPDSLDEARLFINYTQADDSTGEGVEFSPNQDIETDEITPVSSTIVPNGVGRIASVTVEEGVYYFNGYFVYVEQQVLFVTPEDPEVQGDWDQNRTAKIGLQIIESIVTANDDPSLYENSLNTSNDIAEGADRLEINAVLIQLPLNQPQEDFVDLIRVSNGIIQQRVYRSEYSVLQDTLARRTFDESGDYTVKPFLIQVKDFLQEIDNEGVHSIDEFKFPTADQAAAAGESIFGISGSHLDPELSGNFIPGTSHQVFLDAARGKLSVQVDPGKAYVKGYEIEKIAPNIVDFDRARDLRFSNNRVISCPLGTFVYVTQVFGTPNFESYETVDLYKSQFTTPGTSPGNPGAPATADKIGTAKALMVEYFSGTHGTPSGVYRLFLFDIQASPGEDLTQLKSIAASSPTFSANTVLETFRLTGSVSSAANELVGNGTTWVTDPSQQLKIGDYVLVAGFLYKVTAVNSDTSVNVTPDPNGDFSDGQVIDFVFSLVQGYEDAPCLLYILPDKNVYTIRGADENNNNEVNPSVIDTTYTIKRIFSASSSTGMVTLTLTDPDEQFPPFSPNDYIVIDLTDSVTEEANNNWVNLTTANFTFGTNTVTISGLPSGGLKSFYIIASVQKLQGNASKERSKNLIRGSFPGGIYSGPEVVSPTGSSDLSSLSLEKADILQVSRIVQAPDFNTTPSNLETLPSGHKDITAYYDLDDGQRDYFYGIGQVNLKPGAPRPTGRIRVEYDYFTHGTSGNYFSVDSYPFKGVGANMTYDEIPSFDSPSGAGSYNLADSIDFRPRVNEPSGVGFSNQIELPRDAFRADYHFYLNRIDKLYLDKSGGFFVKKGEPDVVPSSPSDPETGMTLYEFHLQGFTAFPAECVLKYIDNRRYTMRDIGKLEKRIENLEYYTVLSLLEKETSDLSIKDAEGNDRFKNGFIVDDFTGTNVVDVTSPDFRCAMDRQNKELRPIFYRDSVSLSETNLLESNPVIRNSNRAADHYTRTGALYTLPFTTGTLLEQSKCSKISNINPYNVFTFVGRIKLSPSSDDWRSTRTIDPAPAAVVDLYDAAKTGLKDGGISWGSDIRSFIGADLTTTATGTKKLAAGHNSYQKTNTPNSKKTPGRKDKKAKRQKKYKLKDPADKNLPLAALNNPHGSDIVQEIDTSTLTVQTQTIRQGIQTLITPGTTINTSLGNRIVDIVEAEFMRSREVSFSGEGFFPNTRLFPFFDGINVAPFCRPENGLILGNYGDPLVCDSLGRIRGRFLIPDPDLAPDLAAELFAVDTVPKFRTGERIFRLTSDSNNTRLPTPSSYGDSTFRSVGWINIQQESLLSTRTADVNTKFLSDNSDSIEVKQLNITTAGPVCREDPIAQSFFIREKGGSFMRAVDVFFYGKSTKGIPVKLQIRPLGPDGLPTNVLVPFSEVIKPADDVVLNLIDLDAGTLTVKGNTNSGNPETDPGYGVPPVGVVGYTSGPWDPSNNNPTNNKHSEDIYKVRNASETFVQENVAIPFSSDPSADMIPTRFVFESPVYLSEGVDYCFVLLSDSDEYLAWVAQYGPDVTGRDGIPNFREAGEANAEIGTNKAIQKDPFVDGIYFKSSNGRSWVPDPSIDVKFKLHKCVFDISTTGVVEFVNNDIATQRLGLDPIQTFEGSTKVRVLHSNHGMSPGLPESRVVLSGVAGGTNGMTLAAFNNTNGYKIEAVELDSYVIDLTGNSTPATSSGSIGGRDVFATENKRFESGILMNTHLTFPETDIKFSIQPTTGRAPNDTTTQAYVVRPYISILPNTQIDFDESYSVSSVRNERNGSDTPPGPSQVLSTGLGDKKSLHLRAVLSSTNPNISPILDQERISWVAIANRVDDPVGFLDINDPNANVLRVINQTTIDDFVINGSVSHPSLTNSPASSLATKVYFYGDTSGINRGKFYTQDAELAVHFSKLDVGKTLTITGAAVGQRNVNKAHIVSVVYTPNETIKCTIVIESRSPGELGNSASASGFEANNITITQQDRFIDEYAPTGGSVGSKYVTRKLLLSRPSNALKISFDAHRDESGTIDLYYRNLADGETTPIEDLLWTKATFNLQLNGILTPITPDANKGPDEFTSYEATVEGLSGYTACQTKIVMRGRNGARPIRIKNFKMIALDE